jgi:hypothetical protein
MKASGATVKRIWRVCAGLSLWLLVTLAYAGAGLSVGYFLSRTTGLSGPVELLGIVVLIGLATLRGYGMGHALAGRVHPTLGMDDDEGDELAGADEAAEEAPTGLRGFLWTVGVAVWLATNAAVGLTILQFVVRAALDSTSRNMQVAGLLPLVLFTLTRAVGSSVLLLAGSTTWLSYFERVRRSLDISTRYGRPLAILHFAIVMATLTLLFSSVTALLFRQGYLQADPGFAQHSVLVATENYYAWNAADAVPALKIPETMHWTIGPTYNDWRAGLLLLAYKATVLVALAKGIVDVLRNWKTETP